MIPIDYEPSGLTTMNENLYSKTFLCLFDYFTKSQGFEIISKIFDSNNGLLPITWFRAFNVFYHKDLLVVRYKKFILQEISKKVIFRLENLKETEIKDLDYQILFTFLSSLQDPDGLSSDSSEKTQTRILIKMLKSTFMDKRIKGINELTSFLEADKKPTKNEDLYNLIKKESLIPKIINESIHFEVLKRAIPLLKFVSFHKGISINECESI